MARNIAVPCKKTHFQAGTMKRQTVPRVHDVTSLLQRRTTVALLFRRHDVVTSHGLLAFSINKTWDSVFR